MPRRFLSSSQPWPRSRSGPLLRIGRWLAAATGLRPSPTRQRQDLAATPAHPTEARPPRPWLAPTTGRGRGLALCLPLNHPGRHRANARRLGNAVTTGLDPAGNRLADSRQRPDRACHGWRAWHTPAYALGGCGTAPRGPSEPQHLGGWDARPLVEGSCPSGGRPRFRSPGRRQITDPASRRCRGVLTGRGRATNSGWRLPFRRARAGG